MRLRARMISTGCCSPGIGAVSRAGRRVAVLERFVTIADAASMRSHGSCARIVALVAFVVLACAPTAPAAAGGGVPGPLRSGGAAYGSAIPRPDSHPVASLLRVAPREV